MNDLKDLKGIAGIYCLKNEINNKVYVGLSKDIARRLREHYNNSLNNKCHHLYNAINKYGVNNFSVSILEITNDTKSLIDLERKWINELDSCNRDKGYNIQETAENGAYIVSDETKQKISKAKKGVPMNETHKANASHSFYKKGHIVSDEIKRKRANSLKQAWANGAFDHLEGNRIAHNKGQLTSEETKRKQSEAKKGKKWTEAQRASRAKVDKAKKVHQFTLDNQYINTFDSAKAIEESTNKDYRLPGVMKCCNGGSKYYKDYIFKYEDDVILIENDKGKTFTYKDGSIPEIQVKTRKTRTKTTYKKKVNTNFGFSVAHREDIV